MGKSPCCNGVDLKRGPWTQDEDTKLLAYIHENGHGSWRTLPQKAGLKRCGKSCRLRWINYLRPDIKRGEFTAYEEQRIIQLHALLGNRWSVIASHLPNRTDNEIKNYWNTHIKKRLTKMGIDPITHKKTQNIPSSNESIRSLSIIHHIAQWESTRLEAEARLAQHSKNINVPHAYVPNENFAGEDGFFMRPSFDILKAWQSGYGSTNGGVQPYTLSIGHGYDNIRSYDNILSSQNYIFVADDNKVLVSEDGNLDVVLPCNEGEWNIGEENYLGDFFVSNNPETLCSLVF